MKPGDFRERNQRIIDEMGQDRELQELSREWLERASKHEYSYHFRWLGRPIIQYPQDVVAMQEIIWEVKPDLIIETGVARGGSIVFYSSMLELIGEDGEAVGIDIDIRDYNRPKIENHPMNDRITLLEGSSIDEDIVDQVYDLAESKSHVLVALDSLHTHEHVREELERYSPLVTEGSYLVVFDTIIEDMDQEFSTNRPWGPGNNPKTAVEDFLETSERFEVDSSWEKKLGITVAPGGYLKCTGA